MNVMKNVEGLIRKTTANAEEEEEEVVVVVDVRIPDCVKKPWGMPPKTYHSSGVCPTQIQISETKKV